MAKGHPSSLSAQLGSAAKVKSLGHARLTSEATLIEVKLEMSRSKPYESKIARYNCNEWSSDHLELLHTL